MNNSSSRNSEAKTYDKVLAPDTLLQGGKYRIIEPIGQGGFGVTYLAEHVMARRKVCIKEFFPKEYYNRDADSCSISLASNSNEEVMSKFKSKFVKEARILAALNHQHIIAVYDVFEEYNTAYYVMEYIEGGSLRDNIKRVVTLPEDKAVKYVKDIASALDYIHKFHLNHLDVKPGNILVRAKDDSAILIDFGLSKHYNSSGEQTTSTPVGVSHGYAPIEQYKSGGVSHFSPATDIYSLGATLYYLVTGNTPPQATDIGEKGLPKLPDHLSEGVRQAIVMAMQYWRKERPQSIEEFIAILEGRVAATLPVADNNASMEDEDAEVMVLDVELAEDSPAKAYYKPEAKPEPKPEAKLEHKPKNKKRSNFLTALVMIIIGVIAAITTFILLGGGGKQDDKPKTSIIESEDSNYVDLGLGSNTKWATCNIGANKPSEYGKLLTFEEAQDACGTEWRLPTKDEFDKLIRCCEWTWKNNGYEVKGSNGNSIFLPASGFIIDDSEGGTGEGGYYWSSTINRTNETMAHRLFFNQDPDKNTLPTHCHYKIAVRPVKR